MGVRADISSAKDSLGLSYIKAKGCAEREKYVIDPTHPTLSRIPTIGTAKEKF